MPFTEFDTQELPVLLLSDVDDLPSAAMRPIVSCSTLCILKVLLLLHPDASEGFSAVSWTSFCSSESKAKLSRELERQLLGQLLVEQKIRQRISYQVRVLDMLAFLWDLFPFLLPSHLHWGQRSQSATWASFLHKGSSEVWVFWHGNLNPVKFLTANSPLSSKQSRRVLGLFLFFCTVLFFTVIFLKIR